MSWNCNTFRRRDVLQSPLISCQISQERPQYGALFAADTVPSAAFAVGRGGTTELCSLWPQAEANSADFAQIPRAPITNQRSVCDGKRRSKGASAVFAISRRLTAETETSGLCFDDRGVYRFRRGYGGGTSGRRRLTAIKRAIYKSNNNRQVAIAA